MNDPIEIFADKISVMGPRIDGTWKITFDVGEYEQGKVAQLLAIPQQTTVKLVVSTPPTLETMDAAAAVSPTYDTPIGDSCTTASGHLYRDRFCVHCGGIDYAYGGEPTTSPTE